MNRRGGTSCPSAQPGFTLLELLTVVIILSILAAIALPVYGRYVERARVTEAFSFLADYQVKMEQYFQDNRRYGTSACADGSAAPAWNGFNPQGAQYFAFRCALTPGGSAFTITATGSGRMAAYAYSVDESNVRKTTQYPGLAGEKACWLRSGAEC